MTLTSIRCLLALAALAAMPAATRAQTAPPTYGLAMHGEPALPPDFSHLPYADPDAPKGGRLNLAYLGAFDSLNPYNIKAFSTAQGLNGNVYQTLMARSADEPFTMYGLIARSIETNDARDRVVFHLDPRAHFSDGAPIRAADVLFTFNLLKEKGRPQQRAAISAVKSIDAPDDETVRMDLTGANDRELPLTLALMPVLSPAHTDGAHFEDQTLVLPVASGPYRVAEVQPGQQLVLRRDPNYWARDSGRADFPHPAFRQTCRSRAGSIISTRSVSTITGTRPRCSRRSRRASTIFASRTTRRAG
jgi:peptide/nickel transport system substrate-binding protein